jgi:hypothetical protein
MGKAVLPTLDDHFVDDPACLREDRDQIVAEDLGDPVIVEPGDAAREELQVM